MPQNDRQPVTVIVARGRAEAKFSSATFKASVTQTAETGPKAKEMTVSTVDKIKEVLRRHAGEAQIDMERLLTAFHVSPCVKFKPEVGEHVPAGYNASYAIQFEAKNVGAATALHDQLTSIDGATVQTPIFNVAGTHELEQRAFKEAVLNARTRFTQQCEALGLNVDDYEIVSWRIEEERGHIGKGLAMDEEGTLRPGESEFVLKAYFTFDKAPLRIR